MSTQPYILHGFGPSPYSVKMRALLRYRRLPFVWKAVGWPRDAAVAAGLPPVIPVLQFPDGTVMNDSTPLAHALERAHPGQRSVVPDDPAQAFLSDLLEDFGDEWVTKIMFHYRWFYAPDREFAQGWVITSRDPQMPEAERREGHAGLQRSPGRSHGDGRLHRRQPAGHRGQLPVHPRHARLSCPEMEFLFGSRPSLAEFGLFGQLQILSVDPTPMAEMRARAPDLYCWLMRLDDASGIEGEWLDAGAPLPAAVIALLTHCGETYLPFLAANRAALESGAPTVDLDILGRPWSQAPFRYQAKCYDALRKKLAALPVDVRRRLDPVLDAAGCLRWLE